MPAEAIQLGMPQVLPSSSALVTPLCVPTLQANTFRTVYEPLFYQHQVDLVFAGHTHA